MFLISVLKHLHLLDAISTVSDLTSRLPEGQYFGRVFVLGVFHSPIFVIPLKRWSFYHFMNTLRITC